MAAGMYKMSRAVTIISLICTLHEIKSIPVQNNSPYPPQWRNAASSIKNYPLKEVQGKKVHVINPWNYVDRLGAYKIMVITTEIYFKPWGFNNTGNLLWGLPLQFGWQMTSGRLQVQANPRSIASNTSLEFTPASWWADMNYYLSIIPFLGAVNAGLITPSKYPFHILLPANVTADVRDKFCTSVTQCQSRYPTLMEKWTTFFDHLRTQGRTNVVEDMDVIVGLLWDAHTTSIRIANPMFKEELNLLSLPEMHFSRGWALLVVFIASTNFQTNMNNTYQQQVLALPPRILHSGDHPPNIPDFTKIQNKALETINVIYEAEKLTEGGFSYIWKKAMCSAKGRADGRDMLENLLEHPIVVIEDLIKLVIDFMRDHDC